MALLDAAPLAILPCSNLGHVSFMADRPELLVMGLLALEAWLALGFVLALAWVLNAVRRGVEDGTATTARHEALSGRTRSRSAERSADANTTTTGDAAYQGGR